MRIGIEVERDTLVFGVDECHLLRGMLRRDRLTFKQKHNARIVDPSAKDCIEREVTAAHVLAAILFLNGMSTFESNLVGLVANVELCDVALFGELYALLVGELPETPKHAATALAAMMEAVAAALLFAITNCEIRLSSERLDSLLDDGFSFLSVCLVRRYLV